MDYCDFIYPYIKDKSAWPYEPDMFYWNHSPVRLDTLVPGGIACSNKDYIDV
jgi:hypothetical protein